MRKTIILFSVLLTLFLLIPLAAGCSQQNTAGNPTSSTTTKTQPGGITTTESTIPTWATTNPDIPTVVVKTVQDWEWQNPLPQGNTLRGICGSSGSNIYAVGDCGSIMHYDGAKWSSMDSGTDTYLTGIWGNSATDIFPLR